MTDVRDRLLLTKELRQRAPDVMIFTLDADLLYSHPDQYPWTTDVVVVSSYPLHSVAQLRTTPSDLQSRPRQPQQFQNFSSQGIYNATVTALNYSVDGRLIDPERARLVDYAPHQGQRCPPIWISVVGRESLWPVATESECSDETQKYMVIAAGAGSLQSDAAVESEPSRGTIRLLVAIVLGLSMAAFIGQRHLWHPYAREAFVFAILSLLGGAVWFGQQLPAVLLTVLVLTVVPVAAALPGRYSESRFGWVPLVAAAAVGVPVIAYVVLAARQPFITATRLLEVENGVSPLVPVLMMAGVPLLLSAVVLRHRYLRGGAGRKAPVTGEVWKQNTIDLLDSFALGSLRDLSPTLTAIYKDLFYLPSALWVVVGASLLVVAFIIFDVRWPFFPVWSVNGRSFGFAVLAVVLTLQFLLTVSLLQFLLQWRACAELLRRLARHPLGPAYQVRAKEDDSRRGVAETPSARRFESIARPDARD